MKFQTKLTFAALIAAAALTSEAKASWELVSGTATIHHDTGDALAEGLATIKTINLAGDTVTQIATCSGQVRKVIVGTGVSAIVTTQTFDAKGNLLSRRDVTGAGADYVYDALGRKLTEADAQITGKIRTYTYDAANRLVTSTDPLGITTTYAYDLRDRRILNSTPMNGTETRLIQWGYDGRGHLTTLTDANGAVTTWGFDSAGRQISKLYANGDTRSMAYDAAGRLVTLTDENGKDAVSVYDLAGRLLTKSFAPTARRTLMRTTRLRA
jgi:YD repeat-containing protein